MTKKIEKPIISLNLKNLNEAIFENEHSLIWENVLKSKTFDTIQEGKKTLLVVEKKPFVQSTLFLKKKNT